MRHAGLAAILLAAACGGAQTAPAKVEVAEAPPDAATTTPLIEPEHTGGLAFDFSQASWATDDEAMTLWKAIGLTGENYQLLLGEIPPEPAEAMSKALLRQGGFAGCATTKIPISCDVIEEEFLEVPPEATIDDPCLRRRLALWALDNLDDRTLTHEMIADAVALAALPPPEGELNRGVLYRIHDDEAIRLQMIEAAVRAGNTAIADEALGGLSIAGLEAAAALHLDGAVEALDGTSSAALGKAILDPLLRRDTRVAAARELGYYVLDSDPQDPNRQTAYDAIKAGTSADDCAVAGAAMSALAQIEDQPWPAPLPRTAKAPAVIRQMCEITSGGGDEEAMWKRFLDEGGVTLRRTLHDPGRVAMLWEDYPDAIDADKDGAPDVDDADPDGDGDPTTIREIVHYDRADWMSADDLESLRRALPACVGTTCKVDALGQVFTLHFRKSKKSLVLDAIDLDETTGGC